MTATQCAQRLHPSFRGQGRKRRSLWAEFPNSGLKAQAGSPPSHSGGCWPIAEQQSVFLQMRRKILSFLLPLGPEMSQIKRSFCFQKCFLSSSCLRAQPIQAAP